MEKIVYVVGIGPGGGEGMTRQAAECLSRCSVIVGYPVYTDLIREEFPDKKYVTTGMKREIERCRAALEEADQGQTVAVVCSGDAGVFGMASPVLQLSAEYPEVGVRVIPGVTAALSGGAVLGAPLTHDFAVISLSDLMTPWEKIEKRLRLCARADMAMAIYNPSSHKRSDYLERACSILLEEISPDTVCGYVRSIGREGEEYRILPLAELKNTPVDMFTTVFIGNSQTVCTGERMVTPRGYTTEKA